MLHCAFAVDFLYSSSRLLLLLLRPITNQVQSLLQDFSTVSADIEHARFRPPRRSRRQYCLSPYCCSECFDRSSSCSNSDLRRTNSFAAFPPFIADSFLKAPLRRIRHYSRGLRVKRLRLPLCPWHRIGSIYSLLLAEEFDLQRNGYSKYVAYFTCCSDGFTVILTDRYCSLCCYSTEDLRYCQQYCNFQRRQRCQHEAYWQCWDNYE